MKTYMNLCLVALLAVLAGCVEVGPQLTPLEIQALQSRQYESDKETVFASTMTVFQDTGYTIKSADIGTGFITAESAASSAETFLEVLFDEENRVEQTLATATVETIGDRVRVRLNFVTVETTSSIEGQAGRRDTPILDAEIYQNVFERIENEIFVRSAN